METRVQHIPIHEAYPKRWSEPTTIIYHEDTIEAERNESTDNVDGEAKTIQNDMNGNIQIIKGLKATMPDIRIHSDIFANDYSKCQGQSENEGQSYTCKSMRFRTPQKHESDFAQSYTQSSSEIKKSHSETYLKDLMLPERSSSRSPPSPAVGSRSPISMQFAEMSKCRSPMSPAMCSRSRSPDLQCMSPMPKISPMVQNNVFNYSPDCTARYKEQSEAETRKIKKRLFEPRSEGKHCCISLVLYTKTLEIICKISTETA